MLYTPIYKSEDLLLSDGAILVVAGWTPKERVKTKLDQLDIPYGCIGNLYNAFCGLTPLVANLIFNQMDYPMHILDCTRQDRIAHSCEALKCFLDGYYIKDRPENDDERWVVLSPDGDIVGELDASFKQKDLDNINKNYYYWTKLEDFYAYLIENPCELATPKGSESNYYKIVAKKQQLLPARQNGITIQGINIASVWPKVLHAVYNTGETVGNRRELLNVTTIIEEESEELFIPSWFPNNPKDTVHYCYDIIHPTKESSVAYTYGSRIAFAENGPNTLNQLEAAIELLARDPNTNRAVISLWVPKLDSHSEQPPCLNHILLKIYKKELVLTATFRSHDMYTAYCSNVASLRYLQEEALLRIKAKTRDNDLKAGKIVCHSQAAHIYDWSLDRAKEVIDNHYVLDKSLYDPVGNFLVSGRETGINIAQHTPKGRLVKDYFYPYSSCQTFKICQDISKDNPTVRATHLVYLALEIEEAKRCKENGLRYVQDKVSG